jgi:tRNA pseudouridine(38-40) synthase
VEKIWRTLIERQSIELLPPIICGNSVENPFGLTDLNEIHRIGQVEFSSGDPKYKRTTLAFCIGYLGSAYTGYQQQRGVEGILTVEDDLDQIFGKKAVAAGRTDKGVSAFSQIVSFSTYDAVSPDEIIQRARQSESCRSGRLAIWNCKRVPRKFHPLFGATWRRYLYLFPLQPGSFSPYSCDVDIAFITEALSHITGTPLPFNGFAHRENRATEEGNGDICTLYRTCATVISIGDFVAEVSSRDSGITGDEQVLCIELVGDRFLRRMVRILVATVVRESVLPVESRNVRILLDIALSRNRYRAAAAVSSIGLALCGVGFDLEDLADLKGSKKSTANVVGAAAGTGNSAKRNKRKLIQKSNDSEMNSSVLCTSENGIDNEVNASESIISAIATTEKCCEKLIPSIKSAGFGLNKAELSFPEETGIKISIADPLFSWHTFRTELISYEPELLFQPERAFSFVAFGSGKEFSLILSQSYEEVGSTIWDAETLLAHYLNDKIMNMMERNEFKMPSLLELGAGTALAALTWVHAWKSGISDSEFFGVVVCQETPDVVQKLQKLLVHQPLGDRICTVGGFWGSNLLQQTVDSELLSDKKFDLVVMADVFYHEEHFEGLLLTIFSLLASGGDVVIVFEQRRKDLSELLLSIANRGFQVKKVHKYIIPRMDREDVYVSSEISTVFYVCHFSGFVS